MDIEVKGDIVDDDSAWLYDWLGYSFTSPSVVNKKLKEANGEDVNVKINSPGGDVFAASEIYTSLRSYKGNVNIEIVGLAASAGSVISMAGNSKMSPTAQMMIHNVSSRASGDYRDMDHMSEVLRNANDTIANAYICKTGMSREEALEMMNNETWLSAQRAKELGLIDEIMFEETNKVDLSNLNNSKFKNKLYNSFSSIPSEIIDNLINKKENQPLNNKVDFFMQQKAKAQLQLINLKKEVYINE